MIDLLVQLVLAAVAIAGIVFGVTGRREAKLRERNRIATKITEADHDTAQDIQKALASHPGDRDRARERLQSRLAADD